MPESNVKIIIPENTNETQILVDGENIINKLSVKRLRLDVKPGESTTVHLEVYADHIEVDPKVLKLHGIKPPDWLRVPKAISNG